MYKPSEEYRYFVMHSDENAGKRYTYKGAIYEGDIIRNGGYVVLWPRTSVINSFGEVENHYLPATQDEMATGVILSSELFHLVAPEDRTEIIWLEDNQEERPKIES